MTASEIQVDISGARIYNCGGISENSFTKIEMISIYINKMVTENHVSRQVYREFVYIINTCLRDYDEIKLGMEG